jgi:hypothetical protein
MTEREKETSGGNADVMMKQLAELLAEKGQTSEAREELEKARIWMADGGEVAMRVAELSRRLSGEAPDSSATTGADPSQDPQAAPGPAPKQGGGDSPQSIEARPSGGSATRSVAARTPQFWFF